MHPEVQKKAQKELDEVVGVNRIPTFEDRDHLPYMNAIFKEAARWQTVTPLGSPFSSVRGVPYNNRPIPGNSRRTLADDVYEGYFIPKVSEVSPSSA